jgi:2-methylcitrate dehydratase PrpD
MRVDPETAALTNAGAAQALDFDDWAPGCAAHLGGVMVPAIAALAAEADPAARALDGLILGLMTVDVLSRMDFQQLYDRGLQPTHLLGTIGAVVGLCYALDLPSGVAASAFGLAATQVLGLRAHTGTSYKGAQGGVAAAAAVRCVQLARAGLGAGNASVDTVLRLVGFSPAQLTEITARRPCALPVVAQKAYPSCGASHTAIEAVLRLRESIRDEHGPMPEPAEIVVASPPQVLHTLAFPDPASPDQARFSMPYCVALAWEKGEVQATGFEEPTLSDARMRRLAQRVTHRCDPTLAPPAGWSGYAATVTVRVGRRSYQEMVTEPLGYPNRPLTPEQSLAKFRACTQHFLDESKVGAVFDALGHPETFQLANLYLHRTGVPL